LVVIDPLVQFSSGLSVGSFQDFENYFSLRDPDFFRVLCQFVDDEIFSQTENVLKFCYELGDLDLVIDEVDKICSSSFISPALWKILNYGRHKKINVYCCARRPARVSRDLTSISDEVVCFKTSEPVDLKYLSELGFDPGALKNLELFEYLSNTN
jgi:hypothetical protein